MAKQAWLSQIRNARNSAEQIGALRALKNEIIGHPLRKELAIELGILDPVVRLTFNKAGSKQDGKSHDHSLAPRALNEEEMVRLQGLQVMASLALGGPPFLAPLQSSSVLPAILSNLCPSSNPWQLVLASLRALSNLADSAALAAATHTLCINTIADGLFSRQYLGSLCRILGQDSTASYIQNQISITASLISRLCQDERHQQALANSNVLDALATRLASFVVAEGLVIPGAEILAQRDGLQEFLPQAASSSSNLSLILEAIAVIIADSKCRAAQLLYSPSILATLPLSQTIEFSATQNARAAWNAFNAAGLGARQSQLNSLNAIDYLLPWVPLTQLKSVSAQASAFPPLGSSGFRDHLATNGNSGRHKYGGATMPSWTDMQSLGEGLAAPEATISESDDPDSPLIAYLILLIRSRTGLTRLMAASVLTHLYRRSLALKNRENYIALLVVPLLVNMFDDAIVPLKGRDPFADEEAVLIERAIKERVPAILAMLITDSEPLQKAAYDAGVVSKLSKLLKISYDPVTDTSTLQPWSPRTSEASGDFDVQSPRLGEEGQPPLLIHKIKVREATLKAIAALVPFKDEYRKSIVEQGMMPYIVESMNPKPSKPFPKSTEKSDKASSSNEESNRGFGANSVSVLIAACGAVRALSRSVSVLRTTLIDNGVADPVFRLLSHPDIEVQIAATACACNLLTDVSPMRERFQEAGVLKILCEHARSTNAKLRLNALWALKHFVHGVGNDMKRQCVEELGQGWLVQLICDDTENQALNISGSNSDRVHTPDEDIHADFEMDEFEEQVDTAFGSSFARSNSRPSSSRSKSVQQAEVRLAALRDEETNPIRKARKDDIAVQEQGLDFIRNLIGGAGQGGAETTEMIDFLFQSLGQDRVFEILMSKLKPKVINPYNRRSSSSPDTKIIPPQTEIIIAVAYIMVHMAASVPRHRQLVIAQTDLLKLLVPQFNHHSIEVRLALCWLCTNLTWLDDQNDRPACKQRAAELMKLGFLHKLEMLEQDPELNVRERAKSALWQIKQEYAG